MNYDRLQYIPSQSSDNTNYCIEHIHGMTWCSLFSIFDSVKACGDLLDFRNFRRESLAWTLWTGVVLAFPHNRVFACRDSKQLVPIRRDWPTAYSALQ